MNGIDWSKPGLLEQARRLHGKHGPTRAAEELTRKLGREVTEGAVRGALRRAPRPDSGSIQPRSEGGGGGSRGVGGGGAGRAKNPTETRLIIPDAHVPAHHRKAFNVLVDVAKELQPTKIKIIGDFMDSYSLSHHPPRQPVRTRLKDELDATERELDRVLNASPNSETDYLEGNHCGWAASYVAANPNLEGLLTVPELLHLKEKGVRWVSLFDQDNFQDGPVAYLHGVYEGTTCTRKHAEIFGPRIGSKYVVHGHNHGMDSFTSPAGYTARGCGFLGDERHIAFSYRRGRPTAWVLGFIIQEINGGSVSDTEVRIDYATGRTSFHGRRYGDA
jgi:hypothetical protein